MKKDGLIQRCWKKPCWSFVKPIMRESMELEQREEQLRDWADEQRQTDRGEDGSGCIGYWNLCQCPKCEQLQ